MTYNTQNKLLLHACCGPCSLEPYRVLQSEGWDITIFFSNSNIYPQKEYDKRLQTLLDWADQNNIPVLFDAYNNFEWQNEVGTLPEAAPNTPDRINRCNQCYKLRFMKAAEYAATHSFTHISTTLSVSPYQYTENIQQELETAAKKYDLQPVFRDFRAYYAQATKRSKAQNMYRQKYCGCAFSMKESAEQFKARAEQKAQKAQIRKQEQEAAEQRKKQKQEYQKQQERKKQLLKQYKANNQSAD